MKVVPAVPFGAKSCLVLHQRTTDPDGFVVAPACRGCGQPQHISAEAVKIMGNEFGMASKDELIDLRFRLHQSEKELNEALETIARNEKLEQELVEARETIAEAERHLETFAALAERGYSVKQVKGLLDRFARFKEDFTEAEDTVAEFLDVVTEIAALSKDGRQKVTA